MSGGDGSQLTPAGGCGRRQQSKRGLRQLEARRCKKKTQIGRNDRRLAQDLKPNLKSKNATTISTTPLIRSFAISNQIASMFACTRSKNFFLYPESFRRS